MTCTFKITKEVDIHRLTEANRKLFRDMAKIVNGEASKVEALEYAKSLIDCSRILTSRELYFWCEAEDTSDMPGDIRVEFIYFPTYIAICILAKAYMYLEEDGKKYEPLTDCLYRGLNGAMGRNFLGHGYESEEGLLDTLEIFKAGMLGNFIETHPVFNIEFSKLYAEAQKYAEKVRKEMPRRGEHHFEDRYINRDI